MGVRLPNRQLIVLGLAKMTLFDCLCYLSPDYFSWLWSFGTRHIGIGTCPALDVRNQCSGFIYALSVADQYIRTEPIKMS